MTARGLHYYRCPTIYYGGDCARPGWARMRDVLDVIWATLDRGLAALPDMPDTAPAGGKLAAAEADLIAQADRLALAISQAPDSGALLARLAKVEDELSRVRLERAAAEENGVTAMMVKAKDAVALREGSALKILVKRIEIFPRSDPRILLWTAGRNASKPKELPLV